MTRRIFTLLILVTTLNTTISAMSWEKLTSDFTTDDVIVSLPNSETLTKLFSKYKNLDKISAKTSIIYKLSDKDLSLDDIDRAIKESIASLGIKTQSTIDNIKLNINKIIAKIIKMDLLKDRPISR